MSFEVKDALSLLSFMDLTCLNEDDNTLTITFFCEKAFALGVPVAAVCVAPAFVEVAARLLRHTTIKIATVVNFPGGNAPLASTINTIQKALDEGAAEIDIVFPYHDYLKNEKQYAIDYIASCKSLCGASHLLKVILETGALLTPKIISAASQDMITAGADFLKTSTGKIACGATVEAAETILSTIKTMKWTRPIGFKAAGGIRCFAQAMQYVQLAKNIMGPAWVVPRHFRLGSSNIFYDN